MAYIICSMTRPQGPAPWPRSGALHHVVPEEPPGSINFSLLQNFLYESTDTVAVPSYTKRPSTLTCGGARVLIEGSREKYTSDRPQNSPGNITQSSLWLNITSQTWIYWVMLLVLANRSVGRMVMDAFHYLDTHEHQPSVVEQKQSAHGVRKEKSATEMCGLIRRAASTA